MADWQPTKYLAFAEERARPAADLMARVSNRNVRQICDLGCGPGNSTQLLRAAFPDATITGLDSSPAMIDKARVAVPDARFELGDVSQWWPDKSDDLVFANALFQWVPDHPKVMLGILEHLNTGATLAVQMPDNLAEPSHRLMGEAAVAGSWKEKLQKAHEQRSPLLSATEYHDLLSPVAASMDIWRTTYHHLLSSHQAIADMLSTTGLKPFLDPLGAQERDAFLADYIERLKSAYPGTRDGGVVFPFPRMFIVVTRR